MREIAGAAERWSNEMNSPATTPLLQYSITHLLLAEEFHDIAPPIDYSLISPWLIFLGMFVLLTAIGLIVWFVAKSFRRPTLPQPPGERALALLEQIRAQITVIDPYRFSIRVSDILRRYVTEQFGLPVTRQTSVEFLNGGSLPRCERRSTIFNWSTGNGALTFAHPWLLLLLLGVPLLAYLRGK